MHLKYYKTYENNGVLMLFLNQTVRHSHVREMRSRITKMHTIFNRHHKHAQTTLQYDVSKVTMYLNQISSLTHSVLPLLHVLTNKHKESFQISHEIEK